MVLNLRVGMNRFRCLLGAILASCAANAPCQIRGTGPLEGFVLDRAGRSAAGVDVILFHGSTRVAAGFEEHVRTDGSGFFSIPRRPIATAGTQWMVAAIGPSGEFEFQNLWGSFGACLLQLPPASQVRVKAVDGTGRPMPGLRVRVGGLATAYMPPELLPRFEHVTNAAGEFTFTGDAKSTTLAEVVDDGLACFESANVPLPAEGQTGSHTLVVQPSSSIKGRLVAVDERVSVAGVAVEAIPVGKGGGWGCLARTQSDGTFSLTNLPPGKYWVALREDSLGVGWNFLDQHDLGRGQTLELADIQVADPGRLVCHVFDKATGAPLSGQELRLTGDGGLGMGGPTDANGEVAFAAQPGMYRANVNRVEKRVTVESGKSATLRFDVARVTPVPSLDSGFGDPQPALMARAVDELGHPIPYAVVNSFDDPEPMLTDAQGRVDLSRYAPGYRIRLSQGPRTSRAQVLPSKPWPGNEITFTLVPGLLGAVSGSVAFAKGKPISRVVVDLMSAEPWGRVEQSALTDGAGGFTFDGLVPGKLYYLAVHAGSGATESRKFVVRAGTTRKLGSIAIR